MPRDQSPLLPSAYQVVYRVRRCSGSVSNLPSIPDYYAKTIPISDVDDTGQQGDGQTLTLRSTALALWDVPTAKVTNQATLDALALQIAQDQHDWRTVKFDRLYAGVVLPAAHGLADYTELWQDQYGITTRYRSREWNVYPVEFHQNDGPNNANCKDDTANPPKFLVGKDPCVELYDTFFRGSNGNLWGHRKKVCLEAGRLTETYLADDDFGCWPCSTCSHPMVLTALGCPGYGGGTAQWPLPNAPIAITDLQGNPIASGTTNSNGQFSFANGNAGQSYICTITAQRFNQFVQHFTFTCGGSATMNVCADAGPAPGYACCQNYAYPLKTTLYYTDKNGTRTLQFVPGNWGPGGKCTVGNWQLCYDAPATVSSGDCTNTFEGTTPVGVGYCPNPSMSWDVFGCNFQYPNQYLGCVPAATGTAFFPEVYEGALNCYTSPQETTLTDCNSPWISCYGPRGAAGMTDLPAPYGGWNVSIVPPLGFMGTGTWLNENGYTGAGLYGSVMQGCTNPVGGPYTISE